MRQSATTYIAMCSFTFVPLEEVGVKVRYPEQLPGVGARGWALLDIFVYTMFAKAANEEVRYFYGSERETTRIPSIRYMGGPAKDLPGNGFFKNPGDRPLVHELEDKVARAVAPALLDAAFARPWAPVLELGAMLLSDESLLPFVPKLRAFTRLQTLDLESNRLSDAALTAVAGVQLPQLEALGLAYNSFGDGGIAALCAAIGKRQYPRLRVLSAHNNALGDQGLLSLAGVCDSLGALQELALQQNKVGDAGMAKLCAAWAGSQAFKPSRVFLSHNALTSASLTALGDLGDASWQWLKSLKLEGNAFSDDALRSFGGKIKQYVLDKSCFTDLDPGKQLGITFPPWPKKVEVSGEPTIRLLSTDALLSCEALRALNSDDVVRLHWKAKGHVRELFPEEAFKVCSLSELCDGVQYSALTYMCATHTLTRTAQRHPPPSTAHVAPSPFPQVEDAMVGGARRAARRRREPLGVDRRLLPQPDRRPRDRTHAQLYRRDLRDRERVPRRRARERLARLVPARDGHQPAAAKDARALERARRQGVGHGVAAGGARGRYLPHV